MILVVTEKNDAAQQIARLLSESGKPEAIQEKMAVGRLEKFYKQSVLTEQEFIKDSSLTIKKYAEQVSKELGDTITVVAFDRLVRGE